MDSHCTKAHESSPTLHNKAITHVGCLLTCEWLVSLVLPTFMSISTSREWAETIRTYGTGGGKQDKQGTYILANRSV